MLFDALVDDAAVFPPGKAAMPAAVRNHVRHAGMPYARVVGRFCCPGTRLPECAAELTGDARLGVSVIVDTHAADLAAMLEFAARSRRPVIQAVELRLPADDAKLGPAARRLVGTLPDVPAYVEVPRQAGWRNVLDVLASAGRYAKLRTGGPTPEAFPAAAGVAAFIRGCVERSLPFKCTAGLHRALRWQDPTLGWHHGFVNVIGAVHAAVQGGSTGDIVDRLEQTSADEAVTALPTDEAEVRAVRTAFHGFGSCSVVEPVEDLQRLALI